MEKLILENELSRSLLFFFDHKLIKFELFPLCAWLHRFVPNRYSSVVRDFVDVLVSQYTTCKLKVDGIDYWRLDSTHYSVSVSVCPRRVDAVNYFKVVLYWDVVNCYKSLYHE